MNNNGSQPDPLVDFEPWREGEDHDAFVERAREHYARTGEWPPDPLLDEVAEMRRRVLARHGNDYQKVLEWYVELGKQRAAQNGAAEDGANQGGVAGVSRP
ncbi:MAG TPA: hypothetical protein VF006_20180 [Longimicrobium sp.]